MSGQVQDYLNEEYPIISWNDIAQMLVYSDQADALAEANREIAFALPGYAWEIGMNADVDPLDRELMFLEARPQRGQKGEALCPEQVRDAVWEHNPAARDPVIPLVDAFRAWRKANETGNDMGEVSDGHHTFNELYEHRHTLFLALAAAKPKRAWASRLHADGTKIEGWFIAGMKLDGKQITYHLPDRLWEVVEALGIVTDDPPAFDGHTSDDVVHRLLSWVRRKCDEIA